MLLLLVLACTRSEPARDPARPFRVSNGRAVVRLLDQLDRASLSLSADNLPADANPGGEHALIGPWRVLPGSDGGIWATSPPVELPPVRSILAPEGWSLLRGEETVVWDTRITSDPRLQGRWSVHEGEVLLSGSADPGRRTPGLRLQRQSDATLEADWNLRTSGKTALEHARKQLSLGSMTHPCLYLPAPSTASFELALPAGGAQLQLQLGLARPNVQAEARAALRLTVQGQSVWTEEVSGGEPWRSLTADLGPWAGQTVRVELSSESLGDPARDYLCVGDPRVVWPESAEADPVRVVLIGIDTLRVDRLGVNGYARSTSPNLDRLARESVVFQRTWAPAPRTRPSFRTSLTGRWPLRALEATNIGEVLSRAGMQTAGIVANVHLAPRLGFADGYQHWSYDDGARADLQVDRALAWLSAHEQEDSFLFLHLMDPHTFYLAPEPYRDRFVEEGQRGAVPDRFNRWSIRQQEQEGLIGPDQRAFIGGRYDGELAYTDAQVGRLLKALEALPGRTLLIVHSDHGEELWEHGAFEHNHSLYDELNRVLFWVRRPGGAARTVEAPVSLADIAPTIYEALGVQAAGELDGQSVWSLVDEGGGGGEEGGAELAATLEQRPLHLGYLMFDRERWAVVGRTPGGALHKYILHTLSGQQELYDLDADPGERQNLVGADFEAAPWDRLLAEATGWPAGAGWRIDLEGELPPFELILDQPVERAGVIDPEAGLNRRANLEWGEQPAVWPEQIAQVELVEGRVRVRPGGLGVGSLYLLGPGAEARARLVVGEGERPLGPGRYRVGGGALTIRAGSVLVPLESEARQAGEDPASEGQIEALRVLGYLE